MIVRSVLAVGAGARATDGAEHDAGAVEVVATRSEVLVEGVVGGRTGGGATVEVDDGVDTEATTSADAAEGVEFFRQVNKLNKQSRNWRRMDSLLQRV